ncbi:MAG: formylglycine-generating enzyme family protein [Kiritimatiellae bacterium]|nr:formylglycine-generating enzyme family protein [Kiritimatiellia bacterium]
MIATMAAAVAEAAALPQLTHVRVSQDAVTQCVTVDYALDAPAIVTLDVLTNGVSIGAANVTCAYGDVNRLVGGGAHRLCWPAAKSWPGFRFSDDTVSVEVSAWAPDLPPDYMVVDLVVNKGERTWYVAADQLPGGGLQNDKYKTDYLVMRRIPAEGRTFRMGSPGDEPGRKQNETLHYVTLTNDFYMSVFELTQGQYKNVVGELNPLNTKYGFDAVRPLDWLVYDRFRGTTKQWPQAGHEVESGSPMDVFRSVLKMPSLDLPTEAEWEFACRAGTLSARYDGTDFPASAAGIAWLGEGRVRPHAVGLLKPNGYGLYDMYGNVDEYCLDYYADDHTYVAVGSTVVAPQGPANGTERVIRGTGSWWSAKGDNARSAFRQSYTASGPWMCVGYRLICRP